jgi:DNA-binding transcriptional LysR family regulator
VQEGYDLAISPVLPPDSSLMRRHLSGWRYVLSCAPSYLDKHPAPKSPADLAGHNCLLYTYSVLGSEWPFRDGDGNTVVVRVSGNLVTTSFETLRAVAVAGGGVWLSPPYLVSDLVASGALVPLLPDYRVPDSEIVVVYPHRRYLPAKVRAFIDLLVDRFASEQRWLGGAPSPGPA